MVVRWRVRRGSGPGVLQADTITLRILRPTGVMAQFTAMGTSEAHPVPGGSIDPVDVYEYPTRLPITAGDSVGLGTTAGSFAEGSAINAAYLTRINALTDGQSATFALGAFADQKKGVKTHHPRAKVKFSFSSDEVGLTFECKLDRKPFKPCSPPKRYRVKVTEKAKKHTFRVQAIDLAGNKDATPAKRSFKVKRLA